MYLPRFGSCTGPILLDGCITFKAVILVQVLVVVVVAGVAEE